MALYFLPDAFTNIPLQPLKGHALFHFSLQTSSFNNDTSCFFFPVIFLFTGLVWDVAIRWHDHCFFWLIAASIPMLAVQLQLVVSHCRWCLNTDVTVMSQCEGRHTTGPICHGPPDTCPHKGGLSENWHRSGVIGCPSTHLKYNWSRQTWVEINVFDHYGAPGVEGERELLKVNRLKKADKRWIVMNVIWTTKTWYMSHTQKTVPFLLKKILNVLLILMYNHKLLCFVSRTIFFCYKYMIFPITERDWTWLGQYNISKYKNKDYNRSVSLFELCVMVSHIRNALIILGKNLF